MKFRTMKPWAASLGGRSGELCDVRLDLPHLRRVELVHLDEGDDARRDRGEDQRREDDRAEQQPVGEQVPRLLAEHRRDHAEAHQAASTIGASRVPASPTRSR